MTFSPACALCLHLLSALEVSWTCFYLKTFSDFTECLFCLPSNPCELSVSTLPSAGIYTGLLVCENLSYLTWSWVYWRNIVKFSLIENLSFLFSFTVTASLSVRGKFIWWKKLHGSWWVINVYKILILIDLQLHGDFGVGFFVHFKV